MFPIEGRFSLAKDIPLVVIAVQPRLFERFIILSDKSVQRVVLIPYHGLTVLVDSADVAHPIVLVLDIPRNREDFPFLLPEIYAVLNSLRHPFGCPPFDF